MNTNSDKGIEGSSIIQVLPKNRIFDISLVSIILYLKLGVKGNVGYEGTKAQRHKGTEERLTTNFHQSAQKEDRRQKGIR